MKTHFICLANSKKYKERCIAGVIIKQNQKGGYRTVKKNGTVKWIRPVTDTKHGQIPADLVHHIQLMDIIEVDTLNKCPNIGQCENIQFRLNSFKKIGEVPTKTAVLDLLSHQTADLIFGNRNRYLEASELENIDYSLMLIKAESVKIYHPKYKKAQLRVSFQYKRQFYDCPITDVNFINNYYHNKLNVNLAKVTYLTLSLGIPFNERYYKLAAGIIQI